MGIQFEITPTEDYLFVKASGEDDDLEDVKAFGMAILQAAITYDVTRILTDERELVYKLDTFDTFESAKFIAELAPKVGRVALVCHPEYEADAEFWETVAINRGFKVRAFKDIEKAKSWLLAE